VSSAVVFAAMRVAARVLAYIILDLLEMLAYFAAVVALTFVTALVLPAAVALVASLLTVSVLFGYRTARRIERARMRGELR
jgi:hypothetical protein